MSNTQWKLVPVEPTEEMILGFWGEVTKGAPEIAAAKEAYADMLAAAPQPPALGWEPEVIYMLRNTATNSPWRDADKAAFDCAAGLVEYERRELVDRAHVNRLQAKVEDLNQSLSRARKAHASSQGILQAEVEQERMTRHSAEGGWHEANRVIAMQREKLDKHEARNTELERLCDQVKGAYKFLKLCREDKTDTAIDTGAMRDAHEWLRKAAESLGAALAEGKEHG